MECKTNPQDILEGAWEVVSQVRSPLMRVQTRAILLITPQITNHEPPGSQVSAKSFGRRNAVRSDEQDQDHKLYSWTLTPNPESKSLIPDS